jgi:hypothetical protein
MIILLGTQRKICNNKTKYKTNQLSLFRKISTRLIDREVQTIINHLMALRIITHLVIIASLKKLRVNRVLELKNLIKIPYQRILLNLSRIYIVLLVTVAI